MTRKIDWYAYESPALVRGNRLFRHRALLDEQSHAAVVMVAQGPPRAWQRSLDAAIGGICEALKDGESQAEPLLAAAATRIRGADAALVDEHVIQAHAIAISFEADTATIATAGSCRAYLHRGAEHRRLSTPSDAKGLRNAYSFATSSEAMKPEDVVILAPSHVFSVAGVAALARVLHEQKRATPRHLARSLLSASGTAGAGGAVVALRVE